MKCGCHSHNGFILSPEGLAQRERQLDVFREVGLTRDEECVRLDMSGSVSGLIEVEDDFEYDPNHIELNQRLIHA